MDSENAIQGCGFQVSSFLQGQAVATAGAGMSKPPWGSDEAWAAIYSSHKRLNKIQFQEKTGSSEFLYSKVKHLRDFPGRPVAKTPSFQPKGPRFEAESRLTGKDPDAGKDLKCCN